MERGPVLLLLVACFVFCSHVAVVAIPSKPVGFVYKGTLPKRDSVVVEAFFDPLCPYSRDAWPPLKKTFEHYFPLVSVTVYMLPLPYHDNAFVVSRALTVADKIDSSLTYPLLEKFFKHQEKFYGEPTRNMSRGSITKHIIKFTAKAVGKNSLWKVESGFADFETIMATRYSFKYSCSRGVMGTPTFFINGFPMPDDGSELDFDKWKSIIDELISGN